MLIVDSVKLSRKSIWYLSTLKALNILYMNDGYQRVLPNSKST